MEIGDPELRPDQGWWGGGVWSQRAIDAGMSGGGGPARYFEEM